MKIVLLLLVLLTCINSSYAKQNIMHSLYLADAPAYAPDEELSMVGEFGLILASGNTNASTATARINANQELQSWSYQLIADALYKQSEQLVDERVRHVASAQRMFLSGQLDYKFTDPDHRFFVYGEFENNRFNGFRYQAAMAAGWSSKFWQDKSSELKYTIGPGYARSKIEADSSNDDQSRLIFRAAMEYMRKFSDFATFRQFVSTEADQEYTKAKSETSLSTKITGTLAMKLTFIMDLDTSVSTDNEELNTQAAVTLVYQFF